MGLSTYLVIGRQLIILYYSLVLRASTITVWCMIIAHAEQLAWEQG